MGLNLRKDARWAIVVPSSMGVRISPAARGQAVHYSDTYLMQVTSAETNVATISSSLGLSAKVLTNFVKDSPIAALIKSNLRSRNIDFEGPDLPQGGPWGYRHQFNIADAGYGSRGPRVHNDRAGEVGRLLNVGDYDLERLFVGEGVQILHLSGLIAALSPQTGQFCLALAREAKKNGTCVGFDLNYRASFWKNREAELRAIFSEIASLADVLVGNEEDFQLALGIEGPESGGKDLASKIDSFKGMIGRVRQSYPNAEVFGTTLRQVLSVDTHLWGSVILSGDVWHHIEPREIHILDRIGGGDGFVGGLMYGLLKGWTPEKCNQFAWATGALATTCFTDYALPADEEQVWSIYEGNARVKR